MQRRSWIRRVAFVLAVSLPGAWLPVSAGPPIASLAGKVRTGSNETPVSGARVFAANPQTGQVLPAVPTDANGTFEIQGLPAATYELGVEIDGNLYVAAKPVPVPAGTRRQVNVTIHPEQAAQGDGAGAQSDRSRFHSVWNNPLTAAFIVVGAAVVVGILVADATNDEDASPF